MIAYNIDNFKYWLRDGLTGRDMYQKTINKLLDASNDNRPFELFLKDESKHWAVLWARIDGVEFQLTKKKMRLKVIVLITRGVN